MFLEFGKMGNLVLGLDLGPNSIGWALIEDNKDDPSKSKIVDLGVRVFPEGVDAFDTAKEVSRSERRRIARGMRRQVQRRARRQRVLEKVLVEKGLWPADLETQQKLLIIDPYSLRAKGVDEQLTLHEFGRVLLHLSQRRGFLSNRKKDAGDSEVKGMLGEINDNEQERIAGGYPTVGAWLAAKQETINHRERQENDHVRSRHLARQQYLDEFNRLWDEQAKHHPGVLTDRLKFGANPDAIYPIQPRSLPHDKTLLEAYGLHGLLFFQRKMYWPASVVGRCELEPKLKRCPRADRRAQRFRLFQEVNNLRYIDPDEREEKLLSAAQRKLLLSKLSRTKEMTFDQIRKALGFIETIKFNLERGSRSKLHGAVVDSMIAAKGCMGTDWHDRDEQQKDEIVAILADPNADEQKFLNRAQRDWNLSTEEAEKLLSLNLPAGYMNHSLVAIEKLLPHLERGLVYMSVDSDDSALHAAGYLRRDQLLRRIFDKLPDPRRTANSPIGDIPNPVVKRTLTEVRKLVNAILREHGKPDAVHLEMARSLQVSAEKRKEQNKQNRDREAERSDIADKLRENGVRPTRESILRYQLWQAQNQECIYSGKAISLNQLLGEAGGVEIDHILPYSRTLDDSHGNKVVCFRTSNADKGHRTPYEWLGASNPQKYDEICQRAKKLPYSKYRKFLQKELELDSFIARQLTDTAYITKATSTFLKCLFDKEHAVLGLKGQLTSELRWQWGLETVIEELPDSPAWQESNKLRDGEKNRADHRHHAIDAVVLALTNRSRLQQLSKLVKAGGARKHGEILPEPWANFRDDVKERIKHVNVSHRVERKVAGALHEETLYGKTENPTEWVVRKPLENLSANEIEKIRDETIRNLVIARLKEHGIEFGRGKKPDAKRMKTALNGMTMPSGVPIKKVRVLKPEQTIRSIRCGENTAYVKPGSMHHLAIFEWEAKGKKKREAVFVSMLDAIDRLKRKEEVIQRTPPENHESIPADAKFIMSLSSREMVLTNFKGHEKLLTFKTAASTQGQIYFAEHTDARRSGDQTKYVATANSLDARKVTVDPLGRIRWAND
jgi:CRISPR-associated endonuclease Csn1